PGGEGDGRGPGATGQGEGRRGATERVAGGVPGSLSAGRRTPRAGSERGRIAKHPAKVPTVESVDPAPEDSGTGSSEPSPIRYGPGLLRRLRQQLDHNAAILGATGLGLVRRDRLFLAVADDVHLVQRNLLVLVQVPLHRLGARETEPVVHVLGADVV